jgi:iron(III) transport system ATP-binding protein
VWLDLPSGVTVSARLEAGDLPSAGDDVSVSVRGVALTFPAGAPGTGAMLAGGSPLVPAPLS